MNIYHVTVNDHKLTSVYAIDETGAHETVRVFFPTLTGYRLQLAESQDTSPYYVVIG